MKGTNTCRTLRIWIYWGFPCSSLGLLGDGRPSEECNILYYILGSALLRTDYASGEDGREGSWRESGRHARDYSKSPNYEPSSCELSKTQTCIPST